MRHQQPIPTGVRGSVKREPSLPFITDSHGIALEQLGKTFSETKPLAILIGEGKSDAGFLIRRFLDSVGNDVTVVRITEPCVDALAGMREIIHGVGFAAKDMVLADLHNVFKMFLSSQKTHRQRTIICIEEAQDSGRWMHDMVRRLVEMETQGNFGLMVILSGRPGLNDLISEPPLNTICAEVGRRMILEPFTLVETREFVRWQTESAGFPDVGQVFEFDAITLIHELCAGIPDAISILCTKCRELVAQADNTQVTTSIVKKAGKILQLGPVVQLSDAETAIMEVCDMSPQKGRLIIRKDGEVIQEQPLNRERERILIGRDALSDIRIASDLVSRHHALIVISSKGVTLVDLGSTNGTFVDGREIKQRVLQDGQVIGIGDCQIEYLAGDERQAAIEDVESTNEFQPDDADSESPEEGLDAELHSLELELEPDKTKVSAGRRVRK